MVSKNKEDNRRIIAKRITDGAYKQEYTDSTITCYILNRFLGEQEEGGYKDGEILKYIRNSNLESALNNVNNQSIYFLVAENFIYIGKCDKGTPLSRIIDHTNPEDNHFSTWRKALVFLHSKNFENNCDLYETVLYELAKISGVYKVDNNVIPTAKYKNAYKNLQREQKTLISDIEDFTRYNDIRAFDAYSSREFQTESQVYIGTNKNKSTWVPEILTPGETVKSMVKRLIRTIKEDIRLGKLKDKKSLKDIKFLDIACKRACEFLVELSIQLQEEYRSNVKEYGLSTDMAIMNTILGQLYGLCLSRRSSELAQIKMYGKIDNNRNIRFIEDYIKTALDATIINNTYPLCNRIIGEHKEFGDEIMKFDVIIANPPYQDSNNKQIYPYFMLNAFDMARYVCMITKNDWIGTQDPNSENLFTKVRNKALKEKHMRMIVDYPKVGEIFNNVGVSVAYFLYDNEYNGDCQYIQIMDGTEVVNFIDDFSKTDAIIRNQLLANILRRTRTLSNRFGDQLNTKITPFGIRSSGINLTEDVINRQLETLYRTENNTIKLLASSGVSYINPCMLDNTSLEQSKLYNVICGKVVHAWSNVYENVLTDIMILNPGEICTDTWSQLHSFDNKQEAENFVKYLKTQFARVTIKAGYPSYKCVGKWYLRFLPLLDFASNSEIDWSKSIQEIDKQLYKKYSLTQREIDYIESTIKPME